jgi:photosystem II stability/assembly factor-like uncharacterized protein
MTTPTVDPTLLSSLRWRSIGPHRGGRVVAVAGHPTDQATFYMGACAGGVWKSDDAGTYWRNVSDGFLNTASIGAIAVSQSDPNVIYVGTGESCTRGNVSAGDGVYRSTDAGRTWKHLGLEATKHISRVRIHPTNPDVVYVAALGDIFGDSEERGIYRSTDGGDTWERVLHQSKDTGAADLTMDPNNPRILFTTLWQARRQPWDFSSGGPDSAIYRTTDAGETWTEVTDNKGLPQGIKGRMGVAISPAKDGRIWAVIEAKERGLYRSDDMGETWERVSDDPKLIQRPWYYGHVFADPQDSETVWVLNLKCWKSTDGGRTFTDVTMPHGDNHDLWIDPGNPRRMIQGNDGGACVTFNGGDSWSTIYNQPTSQFYRMDADNEYPYRVYATQQDNSAISTPSRNFEKGAIVFADSYFVGSSESGQVAVHPDDSKIVFSGAIGSSSGGGDSLHRYDHRTGQSKIVSVWPEFVYGSGVKDHKHRFQWTYPIMFSPHDSGTLYVAAEVVFRSTNEGHSWEAISPDLTRNDRSKMEPSGGPITKDTTFVENYGTIFAFAESLHEQGVFWAGSDDGLVHISRDGGENWDNITPPDLPEWATVAIIEPSPHDPATAYVAAHRYRLADNTPLLFKTTDYGKTWKSITDGVSDTEFTWVIRADPEREGLLYVGTELGVHVSFDDGGSWQPLRGNLPVVPVHDMKIRGNELAVATHGRSFWILDDLTVLRQAADDQSNSNVHLFKPADTYRSAYQMAAGRSSGPGKKYMLRLGAAATWEETKDENEQIHSTFLDAGDNPPFGVTVHYYLKDASAEASSLTVSDGNGQVIRTIRPKPKKFDEMPESEKPVGPFPPVEQGMNLFVWDMRHERSSKVAAGGPKSDAVEGPLVVPGTYTVSLTIAGETAEQQVTIEKDPRVNASDDEFKQQLDLMLKVRDKITEVHDGINRIRSLREQVNEWAARARSSNKGEALGKVTSDLTQSLGAVELELIQTNAPEEEGLDKIALPAGVGFKLKELMAAVSSADAVPTSQQHDVFVDFSARADGAVGRLKTLLDEDVQRFDDLLHELEIPAIFPKA